jgi:hypothetical protein
MKRMPGWLLGCGLMLAGCGCPGDVQVGSVRLLSGSFWPYSGNDELVFENKEGEVVTFVTSGYSTRANPLTYEVLCQRWPWAPQQSYYLPDVGYTQTFKSGNYYDQLTGLSVTLNVESDLAAAPPDTVFFEVCRLRVDSRQTIGNGGGTFSFLTSLRGQPPARFSRYERLRFRVIPDTMLGNRRYTQVYTQRGVPSLFFTREQGLVAIRTEFTTWTLKRLTRR